MVAFFKIRLTNPFLQCSHGALFFPSQTPTAGPGEPWLVQDVVNWLIDQNLRQYTKMFRSNNIDGLALLRMTVPQLKTIGVDVSVCLFVCIRAFVIPCQTEGISDICFVSKLLYSCS